MVVVASVKESSNGISNFEAARFGVWTNLDDIACIVGSSGGPRFQITIAINMLQIVIPFECMHNNTVRNIADHVIRRVKRNSFDFDDHGVWCKLWQFFVMY